MRVGVRHRGRWAIVPLCVLLSPTRAQAQTSDSEEPRRLRVGVGAEVIDQLGQACDQSGDLRACSGNVLLPAFTFGASFRFARWLSIGGRFSAASANAGFTSDDRAPRHISIWQTSLEARVYPFGSTRDARLSPFAGLAFGFASMRETSAEAPEKTTFGSVLIGAAIGADYRINDWLGVAAEARFIRIDFAPSNEVRSDGRSTTYAGKAWPSLGLQLLALLPV